MSLLRKPASCNARVHVLIRLNSPILTGLPEDEKNLRGMFETRLKGKRTDEEIAAMVAGVRHKMGNPPTIPESKYRRRLKQTTTGTYFWGAGQWIEAIADAVFYIDGTYRNRTGGVLFIDPGQPGFFHHFSEVGFAPVMETIWVEHMVPPAPVKRRPSSSFVCSQGIRHDKFGGVYVHFDIHFSLEFFGCADNLADRLWVAGIIGTGTLRTSGTYGGFDVLQMWERPPVTDSSIEHAYQGCSCHEFLLAQKTRRVR